MLQGKKRPQRTKEQLKYFQSGSWNMTLAEVEVRILRAQQSKWGVPKWLQFARIMLQEGYMIRLYEASSTVSKYITVHNNGLHPYKVRFSNHKPAHVKEVTGDCDFFVGRTNLTVTTTAMALAAVREHFADKNLTK